MSSKEEFIKYTNTYLEYGERIELKINHTFRVQKLCEEIALSIGLSREEVEVASLCGLLHDIGRFEQWKMFKTYEDRGTIDHGDLGYKILKKNDFIHKFNNNYEYDRTILRAVKYHNKYSVPKNLSKKDKMFINIVRDADKLDLLYLYEIDVFKIVNEDKSFSPEIYDSLMNKKLVSKEYVKSKTDMEALRFGFVFDFNYLYSYKLIKDKDYINHTIDKQINITSNNLLIEQLRDIQDLLNNYIEERVLC